MGSNGTRILFMLILGVLLIIAGLGGRPGSLLAAFIEPDKLTIQTG